MIVPLNELTVGEPINVVLPNGQTFLAIVNSCGEDPTGGPWAQVDPPGAVYSWLVKWPLQADRLDVPPDPELLPTLTQVMRDAG